MLSRRVEKAISDPRRALDHLLWLGRKNLALERYVGGKKFFYSTPQIRSVSDDGVYISFAARAASDPATFATFRSHSAYRRILEHVSESEGRGYLDEITTHSPALLEKIEDLKGNDLVGGPITFAYDGVGAVSPTTLRYIKVAGDLQSYFGSDIGVKIVEIGIGYGGQMRILDRLHSFKEYHLYDLPPVLALATRYLESFVLRGSYRALTLNQNAGDESYDLAISNYAFSELPVLLQRVYIEKILSRSKRGYLTMNSGLRGSAYVDDKLSLSELRELLPSFEVFQEVPLTRSDNYVIVWGHK